MNVTCLLWQGDQKPDETDIDGVLDQLGTEGYVGWIDLCGPEPDELNALARKLGLHPIGVEAALGDSERVKLTRFDNHILISMYATEYVASDNLQDSLIRTDRVTAFVVRNVLVTVRLSHNFEMDAVRDRWDELGEVKNGIGALVHGLLDVIVDGHFDTVQGLDDAVEDIEDILFAEGTLTHQVSRSVYRLRKDLVHFRRIALPMREVVGGISRHRAEIEAPSELNAAFDDLYDHVLRVAEWTESLRDMISSVFETQLSLQDMRLNTIMKKLTSWAAIIAVPTAITGFYGQNVPYPGFDSHWGFVVSSAIIAVTSVALYGVFKRRGWL